MDIKLLDVVTLLDDFTSQGVVRGHVGTVVEKLGPDVFEIEFSNNQGRTFASLAVKRNQFLVLRHDAVPAA